jgi:hypothetical protein
MNRPPDVKASRQVYQPFAPWRAFTSADGQKSFVGSLADYSEKAGKGKLKLRTGKQAELSLERLSEKDGKWIKDAEG